MCVSLLLFSLLLFSPCGYFLRSAHQSFYIANLVEGVYVSVRMCVRICVYICVCVSRRCAHADIKVNMHVYIYMYKYLCIYIYM